MDVGTSYEDFKAVEECLEKLKKEHHHPLRVITARVRRTIYNRKRINAKNPKPPVDCQTRSTYLLTLVHSSLVYTDILFTGLQKNL